MTRRRINGVPLPDKHKDLGAQEIPPKHQRPHMQGGGGGSAGKGGGCVLVLLGLVSTPVLGDLLLAAS